MKEKWRKSIDLPKKIIAVLQLKATLSGYTTLKPFLERLLEDEAGRIMKTKPEIAKSINTKAFTDMPRHAKRKTR